MAVSRELSMPPLRNTPTGTSETILYLNAEIKSDSSSSIHSSSFLLDLLIPETRFQYLAFCNPLLEILMYWPGASLEILLKMLK